MKILLLSLYFEPDLCAGSFRNTGLFKELRSLSNADSFIHVITAKPNRYSSFDPACLAKEEGEGYLIDRISLSHHNSKLSGQIFNFIKFFRYVNQIVNKHDYDLVYASSSRLFTAFLGAIIAKRKSAILYLDIRDIFVDTIKDVFKNKMLIQKIVLPFFKSVEKYTFNQADHINLVSEGFRDYFKIYTKPTYSYFTNGIDDCFLYEKPERIKNSVKVITYAGNIGEGQGLEKLIPGLCRELGNKYIIRIIGAGGARQVLEDSINYEKINNVELINPVDRKTLLKYYEASDFLLLHLNDYDAFKKVLPSKLFEYCVYPVPILAGVDGYAAKFISKIPYSKVVKCGDYMSLANYVRTCEVDNISRELFIDQYKRVNIMKSMANSILKCKKK